MKMSQAQELSFRRAAAKMGYMPEAIDAYVKWAKRLYRGREAIAALQSLQVRYRLPDGRACVGPKEYCLRMGAVRVGRAM